MKFGQRYIQSVPFSFSKKMVLLILLLNCVQISLIGLGPIGVPTFDLLSMQQLFSEMTTESYIRIYNCCLVISLIIALFGVLSVLSIFTNIFKKGFISFFMSTFCFLFLSMVIPLITAGLSSISTDLSANNCLINVPLCFDNKVTITSLMLLHTSNLFNFLVFIFICVITTPDDFEQMKAVVVVPSRMAVFLLLKLIAIIAVIQGQLFHIILSLFIFLAVTMSSFFLPIFSELQLNSHQVALNFVELLAIILKHCGFSLFATIALLVLSYYVVYFVQQYYTLYLVEKTVQWLIIQRKMSDNPREFIDIDYIFVNNSFIFYVTIILQYIIIMFLVPIYCILSILLPESLLQKLQLMLESLKQSHQTLVFDEQDVSMYFPDNLSYIVNFIGQKYYLKQLKRRKDLVSKQVLIKKNLLIKFPCVTYFSVVSKYIISFYYQYFAKQFLQGAIVQNVLSKPIITVSYLRQLVFLFEGKFPNSTFIQLYYVNMLKNILNDFIEAEKQLSPQKNQLVLDQVAGQKKQLSKMMMEKFSEISFQIKKGEIIPMQNVVSRSQQINDNFRIKKIKLRIIQSLIDQSTSDLVEELLFRWDDFEDQFCSFWSLSESSDCSDVEFQLLQLFDAYSCYTSNVKLALFNRQNTIFQVFEYANNRYFQLDYQNKQLEESYQLFKSKISENTNIASYDIDNAYIVVNHFDPDIKTCCEISNQQPKIIIGNTHKQIQERAFLQQQSTNIQNQQVLQTITYGPSQTQINKYFLEQRNSTSLWLQNQFFLIFLFVCTTLTTLFYLYTQQLSNMDLFQNQQEQLNQFNIISNDLDLFQTDMNINRFNDFNTYISNLNYQQSYFPQLILNQQLDYTNQHFIMIKLKQQLLLLSQNIQTPNQLQNIRDFTKIISCQIDQSSNQNLFITPIIQICFLLFFNPLIFAFTFKMLRKEVNKKISNFPILFQQLTQNLKQQIYEHYNAYSQIRKEYLKYYKDQLQQYLDIIIQGNYFNTEISNAVQMQQYFDKYTEAISFKLTTVTDTSISQISNAYHDSHSFNQKRIKDLIFNISRFFIKVFLLVSVIYLLLFLKQMLDVRYYFYFFNRSKNIIISLLQGCFLINFDFVKISVALNNKVESNYNNSYKNENLSDTVRSVQWWLTYIQQFTTQSSVSKINDYLSQIQIFDDLIQDLSDSINGINCDKYFSNSHQIDNCNTFDMQQLLLVFKNKCSSDSTKRNMEIIQSCYLQSLISNQGILFESIVLSLNNDISPFNALSFNVYKYIQSMFRNGTNSWLDQQDMEYLQKLKQNITFDQNSIQQSDTQLWLEYEKVIYFSLLTAIVLSFLSYLKYSKKPFLTILLCAFLTVCFVLGFQSVTEDDINIEHETRMQQFSNILPYFIKQSVKLSANPSGHQVLRDYNYILRKFDSTLTWLNNDQRSMKVREVFQEFKVEQEIFQNNLLCMLDTNQKRFFTNAKNLIDNNQLVSRADRDPDPTIFHMYNILTYTARLTQNYYIAGYYNYRKLGLTLQDDPVLYQIYDYLQFNEAESEVVNNFQGIYQINDAINDGFAHWSAFPYETDRSEDVIYSQNQVNLIGNITLEMQQITLGVLENIHQTQLSVINKLTLLKLAYILAAVLASLLLFCYYIRYDKQMTNIQTLDKLNITPHKGTFVLFLSLYFISMLLSLVFLSYYQGQEVQMLNYKKQLVNILEQTSLLQTLVKYQNYNTEQIIFDIKNKNQVVEKLEQLVKETFTDPLADQKWEYQSVKSIQQVLKYLQSLRLRWAGNNLQYGIINSINSRYKIFQAYQLDMQEIQDLNFLLQEIRINNISQEQQQQGIDTINTFYLQLNFDLEQQYLHNHNLTKTMNIIVLIINLLMIVYFLVVLIKLNANNYIKFCRFLLKKLPTIVFKNIDSKYAYVADI